MRQGIKIRVAIVLVILVFVLTGLYFISDILLRKEFSPERIFWGVTFSKPYAESLGLDWKKTYLEMLSDMKIKMVRIPAYWSEIEPEEGQYHFEDLDWQINEAAKRGVEVTLVVGRRLPRWPECWEPDWAKGLSHEQMQKKVKNILRTVIERYKDHSIIWYWQVENEPLFGLFGECPLPDKEFLEEEVDLVHSLDHRPVIITDSGELSSWVAAAKIGETLGVTMYRVVWSKFFYFHWRLPPMFYQLKAIIAGAKGRVINTELQAEPWPPNRDIPNTSIEEQFKSMDMDQLNKNLEFARRTGFPQVYIWGAEWWYWMKEKQNDSEFVDRMRDFFSKEYSRLNNNDLSEEEF